MTWVHPEWGPGKDEYGTATQGQAQFTTPNPAKKEGFLLVAYGGNKVAALAAKATTELRQGGWTVAKTRSSQAAIEAAS